MRANCPSRIIICIVAVKTIQSLFLFDWSLHMSFDPARHHRRSIRLAGYDYTQTGAYFVTICVRDRRQILATIDADGYHMSPLGQIVARCWLALPQHFPRVSLDAWVVMPDHIHGIIIIHELPSESASSPQTDVKSNGTRCDSLNAVLQNFKSVSTRKVNKVRRTPGVSLWQRDYYEHIIRDDRAFQNIRRYIEENPARWRG